MIFSGIGASSVVHVVAAVVAVSAFGALAPRLLPPPHGRNSIQLTASAVIELDAVVADEPESDAAVISLDQTSPPPRATKVVSPTKDLLAMRNALASLPESTTIQVTQPSRRQPSEPASETTAPPVAKRIARTPSERTPHPAAPTQASLPNAGQLDDIPATIHSPRPEYPADALTAGVEGRVVLRVELDRDGQVTDVTVAKSSGDRRLDEAARQSVAKWKFEPATRMGVAVATAIAVPVNFQLERR